MAISSSTSQGNVRIRQFFRTAEESPRRRLFILIVVLVFLTLYFTYPFCFSLKRPIASGADFYLNTWILNWGIHQLGKNPLDFYHANIFFPANNALAFADNMLANSILAAPAYFVTHDPIFTYNFLVLVSILIGGIGMYLLAYRLTGNFYAAIVAAIFYEFSATRLARIVQIQLFTSHWTPFALLYLHEFFDRPGIKNTVLLAFFFTLQALSGAYNTVYLSSAIAIGVVFFLFTGKNYRQTRIYTHLLLLAALTFVLVFPFFLPYLKNANELGMVRPSGSLYRLSPDFRSYLAIPTNFYLWITGFFPKLHQYLFSESPYLFPGLAPIILAVAGIAYMKPERAQIFYLVLAAFALVASAGSTLRLYPFLFRSILLFQMTRVPSRFILLVVLCLSVLSAFGIGALLNKYKETGRRMYLVICAILPIFFIVESATIPFRMLNPVSTPTVYKWLASQPENLVITELPFRDPYQARYMLHSIAHWKILTNGYSGYTPPYSADFERKLAYFPDQAAMRKILETSDYLIIHKGSYDEFQLKILNENLRRFEKVLTRVQAFGSDEVYRVQIDFHGVSFARFYPFSELHGKRLSFHLRSTSPKAELQGIVTISINHLSVRKIAAQKNWERYIVDFPPGSVHHGSNRILFRANDKHRPFRVEGLQLTE